MSSDDIEPCAHMIDVDPVLFLNCSKRELMMSGVVCISVIAVIGFVSFLLLGLQAKRYIILPVLSLFIGVPLAYMVSKRIGRLKAGKPHLYVRHKVAIHLARWRDSPYFTHTGFLSLQRTASLEEINEER